MKKVVLSANTSWYLYNFRKNTINQIIDAGHKVYIVAPYDDYTVKLQELGCVCINLKISGRGMNPIMEAKTLLSFTFIYFKLKPDLIFNFTPKNNIYSAMAAYFLSSKVVNNIAGLGTAFIGNSLSEKFLSFLYKISQRRANVIFFQNNEDMKIFIDKKIACNEKCKIIPGSGVDLERFRYDCRNNDGVVKFILIARLIKEKGIPEYAKAAQTLKQKYGERVQFSLAGFIDENNPSAVSKDDIDYWHRNGVIHFLGKTDQIEKILKENDCVVLPSYYREGVPKSLLEAAAMGKIIVTTDNVGCRETIVDKKTGYLCKTKSTASLASALEKVLLMDHDERVKMGIAGREYIRKRFDEKIVINEYLHCLNK
ncbi:glycosyltransferase family 4 protein [Enterobacter ludwigii]|uniref:glycosyltransferase family 4 protein n=1 Tax=Enterobacter ludwigii TaxID=299767 RepID=UPI001E3A1982|nr:glycosyltransferase family 4 protein [Enterobacter ludwigii]MCE1917413.1 glycosyltransferase family 4 protein [Enterobacter ludwigii]